MLYNVIVLEPSIMFCMMHDCVTVTCDSLWQFVTVIYDIMLILNSKFENNKIERKENENK